MGDHMVLPHPTPVKPKSTRPLFLIVVMINLCFLRLYLNRENVNRTGRAHFWSLLMISGKRIHYRVKISVCAPCWREEQYQVIERG